MIVGSRFDRVIGRNIVIRCGSIVSVDHRARLLRGFLSAFRLCFDGAVIGRGLIIGSGCLVGGVRLLRGFLPPFRRRLLGSRFDGVVIGRNVTTGVVSNGVLLCGFLAAFRRRFDRAIIGKRNFIIGNYLVGSRCRRGFLYAFRRCFDGAIIGRGIIIGSG
ncbi:MAG TPA: hypothetical protein VGC41_17690 [Kofleriaceae bacterium]